MIGRALGLGLRIAYDAGLTVFHRIGSDRMRKAYFCRLEFDSAQGEIGARPPVTRRSFLGHLSGHTGEPLRTSGNGWA